MPTFQITSPSGTYEVTAPDEQSALDAFKGFDGGGAQPAQAGAGGYSGSILPFSRGEDGGVQFDSNAGLLGSVKRAIMGPGEFMDSPVGYKDGDQMTDAGDIIRDGQNVGNVVVDEAAKRQWGTDAGAWFGPLSPAVGSGAAIARNAGLGKQSPAPAQVATPQPQTLSAVQQTPNRAEVVGAADRLGIDIPKAVATDSPTAQFAGKKMAETPFVGTPLRNAAKETIGKLDAKVQDIQSGYGTGSIPGAGADLRAGIADTAKKGLSDSVSKRYDVVDNLVTQNVVTPLDKTRQVAIEIIGSRKNAAMDGEGRAVNMVLEALRRPDGLNYQGIKTLRTSVGEILDDPQKLVASKASGAELKRIYAALTDDLKTAVKRGGGDQALSAFEKANLYASRVAQRRKALQKVVGTQSDEGLIYRIQSMASNKSTANTRDLVRARSAVDKETWNEVASAVLSNMGRDKSGNFTPDRFVTAWGSLTPQGRNILFGSAGNKGLARSLDDIVTISTRFKELNAMANHSGTAAAGAFYTTLAGAGLSAMAGNITAPIGILGGLLGGRFTAAMMAKPATAKAASAWAKAYEMAVTKPSKGAMAHLANRAKVLAPLIAAETGRPVDEIVGGLSGGAIQGVSDSGGQNDVNVQGVEGQRPRQ